MGLFGSNDKPRPRGGTTIIAEGTSITGDFDLSGNLHIDGRVEGRILSENDISVGASGSFEGEIRASRIVVSGQIRGRVDCDHLEIVATGKVLGEVSSKAFVIEPGGQFVGESRSSDDEPVKALDYVREPEAQRREPVLTDTASDADPDAGPDVEDNGHAGSERGARQRSEVEKTLN
ncbi:MAG: polymer-forming cytoskeletal protein [Aquisalimonadaceae bacterium]